MFVLDISVSNCLLQVWAWLETLFVDEEIPAFEINSKTIEILSGLVDINTKKDRDVKILIEDLAQKKEEYKSEGIIHGHVKWIGLNYRSENKYCWV